MKEVCGQCRVSHCSRCSSSSTNNSKARKRLRLVYSRERHRRDSELWQKGHRRGGSWRGAWPGRGNVGDGRRWGLLSADLGSEPGTRHTLGQRPLPACLDITHYAAPLHPILSQILYTLVWAILGPSPHALPLFCPMFRTTSCNWVEMLKRQHSFAFQGLWS